jgi:MFS family permease
MQQTTTPHAPNPSHNRGVITAIIVAALGYFVDIYDLILFGVVRIDSLTSLGLSGDALTNVGSMLINAQMAGMLVGGILWGVLGDKRGRLAVLFGSIFLYSAANIANGFVQDTTTYGILRFVAGIGLAGELGAGITLVAELMRKETRGIGTTIIASFGLLGAVAASLVGGYNWNLGIENWRVAYFVGGGLGLGLLVLRINVYESGMFQSMKNTEVSKGDFFQLFGNRPTFFKYLHCILIGIPIWYIIGLLVFFSPEISRAQGIVAPIKAGTSVMLAYLGLCIGDICCGALSQLVKSRKRAVLVFMLISLAASAYYIFLMRDVGSVHFYAVCFLLGFGGGYWAVFVTIGSDQFGTNLRATVTTTVPNFVRGSLVLVTLGYEALRPSGHELRAAAIVGLACFALAFYGLYFLHETFGKDLNYFEEL